jgi:hypothetical protein
MPCLAAADIDLSAGMTARQPTRIAKRGSKPQFLPGGERFERHGTRLDEEEARLPLLPSFLLAGMEPQKGNQRWNQNPGWKPHPKATSQRFAPSTASLFAVRLRLRFRRSDRHAGENAYSLSLAGMEPQKGNRRWK